jgi:hypothetical protein
MTVEVQRLLAEEDAGWRDLHDVFSQIPPERFEEEGVTPEGWSPKDAMFHIGAWLAECVAVLERIAAGAVEDTDVDDATVEAKNAAWFAMSRQMDPATVRAEMEAARAQARRYFGAMAAPTREAWSWFDESGPLHYAEHAGDLRAWLARPVG